MSPLTKYFSLFCIATLLSVSQQLSDGFSSTCNNEYNDDGEVLENANCPEAEENSSPEPQVNFTTPLVATQAPTAVPSSTIALNSTRMESDGTEPSTSHLTNEASTLPSSTVTSPLATLSLNSSSNASSVTSPTSSAQSNVTMSQLNFTNLPNSTPKRIPEDSSLRNVTILHSTKSGVGVPAVSVSLLFALFACPIMF